MKRHKLKWDWPSVADETWPGHQGYRVYQILDSKDRSLVLGFVVSLLEPPKWVVELGWMPVSEYWIHSSILPDEFDLLAYEDVEGEGWLKHRNPPETEPIPLQAFSKQVSPLPDVPLYGVCMHESFGSEFTPTFAWFTMDIGEPGSSAWCADKWPFRFLVVGVHEMLRFTRTENRPNSARRAVDVDVCASTKVRRRKHSRNRPSSRR